MANHITYVTIAYDLYKNKILGQLNAWKRRGVYSSLLFVERVSDGYRLVLRENATDESAIDKELALTVNKKDAVYKLFQYLSANANDKEELIYIRRLGISIIYSGRFFEKIQSKVIYEIPTFPIDSGTNFIRKLILSIELKYYEKKVYPYIMAEPACIQKKMDNLPGKMVAINNAVEVNQKDTLPRQADEYTFLFFGNLQPWHGLDAFLDAVKDYRGRRRIEVTVYSSETACYSELLEKYTGFNNIHFCGKAESGLIEASNTNKTIGIGGLAYESRGADYDTSLKNKDYAAMGIPFIFVLPDMSFIDYKYAYRITDIKGISIDAIIDWFTSIYTDNTYSEIKKYARSNLTYDKQIEELYRMIEK